jgi:hypothetical protein
MNQWQGGFIPNGSVIYLRTTCYWSWAGPEVPSLVQLGNFVGVGASPSGSQEPFLVANNIQEPFTVVTWSNGPNQYMPGGAPSPFQGMILQASDGTYVTLDGAGFYMTGASQDQARVWFLDLSMGNQTQIYDIGMVYTERSSLGDSTAQLPDYTANFTTMDEQGTDLPVLLQWLQGIGQPSTVNIFFA